MEATSDFYIVLPSNVTSDEFPNNTTSDYSTALPVPLKLRQGKWEVALVELHFPHTWYNITSDNNRITAEYNDEKGDKQSFISFLKPGYYTPGNVIQQINRQLSIDDNFKGRLSYDEASGYAGATLAPNETFRLKNPFHCSWDLILKSWKINMIRKIKL